MKTRRIISALLAFVMLFALASCTKEKEPAKDDTNTESAKIAITVKDYGTMVLELYPDKAPITVANFLKYVDDGFYDGLTFHRIYSGFMIQGGDPKGDGTGSGKFGGIKGEFSSNGVANDISHKRGVISMARSNDPNSASSQFFICHADSESLDGKYAAFGMLVEGFDVLDAIASTEVAYNVFGEKSAPLTPPVIESITRVAD